MRGLTRAPREEDNVPLIKFKKNITKNRGVFHTLDKKAR